MSNTIALMNLGQLVQLGSPQEVYRQPVNSFVARFLGSTNLLRAKLLESGSSTEPGRYETPIGTLMAFPSKSLGDKQLGDQPLIAVRPEDVVIHKERPSAHRVIEAEVQLTAFYGDSRLVQLSVAGQSLTATVRSRQELQPGQCVFVELPATACLALAE
jgi:ABC-type sugar transport system ATPase subunit